MNTKLNANPKGEGQLRDLGTDESTILKQILMTLFPAPSSNAVSKHIITTAIQWSKTHKLPQTTNLHSGDYCAACRRM